MRHESRRDESRSTCVAVPSPELGPGQYARVERERRFLLAGMPPGEQTTGARSIVDRYLTGTSLRLRHVSGHDGHAYKFTQKIPAAHPSATQGLITSTYLSKAEHDLLASLPGNTLTKTRHSIPPLGIDVFASWPRPSSPPTPAYWCSSRRTTRSSKSPGSPLRRRTARRHLPGTTDLLADRLRHRQRRPRRARAARRDASGHAAASRAGSRRYSPGHRGRRGFRRCAVIPAGFDYLRPATVAGALELASVNEHARYLAGGHALLPERKLRRAGPSALIDLGRIAELRRIEVLEDRALPQPDGSGGSGGPGRVVRIGAMTTSAEIEYSPDIARYTPLLAEAAAVISDPLIRNRATLGGSLAEADPH